jgi:predicted metal-dependent hydrolase
VSTEQLRLDVESSAAEAPEVPEVQLAPAPRPASTPAPALPSAAPFRVEVTRSKKRKRSVGAQLVGGTLRVAIPAWMSRAEEAHWVAEMSRRFARKVSSDRIDLGARATTLARRYRLQRPAEIRWVGDMTTRWGSCSPHTSTIRISDRIASFPGWVVDYVIVHELAHLDVGGHGPDFWALVHRYPRSERAIGYLIAKAGDVDADDTHDTHDTGDTGDDTGGAAALELS